MRTAPRKIVRAQVYEQHPHPMFYNPAEFVVVHFDSPEYLLMDRRRIKRETNRAVRVWRKSRRR